MRAGYHSIKKNLQSLAQGLAPAWYPINIWIQKSWLSECNTMSA
jgi:hypothetical protein